MDCEKRVWNYNSLNKLSEFKIKLLIEIMDIFEFSHESYGSPRITEELRAKGWTVSQNRVAKMMHGAGIRASLP